MTGVRGWILALLASLLPTIAMAGIDETYIKPGTGSWGADWFKPIFQGDEFGKSYAVVIGIGDYDAYPRLQAPAKDAERVRDFLIEDAGFDDVVTLTDDKATFERINALMEDIYPAKLKANDRFLFYFSGHGDTRDLYGGKRGYLVLENAPPHGWSRMIDMPRVRQWSGNVGGARQSLFILDACFSGLVGFEPKGKPGEETLARLRQPAHHLITAGDEGEQSFAADGKSLFTDAFLRAARGEGDLTGDGLVSLNELMVEVGTLIDQRRKELQDKIKMTPRAWLARTDNNSGEFFFIAKARQEAARVAAQVAVVEPKGPLPSVFDERSLDLAFWESIRDSRKVSDFEAYLRAFPSGIYAALARSRLEDLNAPTAPPSSSATPPDAAPSPADLETALSLSRDDWRTLQRAMTALGFDTGGADGRPGAMTRKALAAWQASRLTDATGYLGPRQRELILAEARPKLAALDAAAFSQSAAPPSAALSASVGPRSLSRKPGVVFRDCPNCPEMVVIPAGSFTMGSPPTETDRSGDEGPQRKVTFAQPFALGRYEVTFAQWDACVTAGKCSSPDDQGWGRGTQPVINVSWQDAQGFVTWLSGKTGQPYRLPTEAEWEYAARAGTTTPFWTGSTISTAQANYDGNYTYGAGAKGIYRARTMAVDDPSLPANPFGLYHIHGNVWEWVRDCYLSEYDLVSMDGSKAIEDSACPGRVLRGGSWSNNPWFLRAANRLRNAPGVRGNNVGFRVARMLTP